MNDKDVIAFLKEAQQEATSVEVERCIASLPEIRKTSQLLPLIKLQIVSMPASMYVQIGRAHV